MVNKRGVFISFEGIDGCGKTTQVNNLMDYMKKNGLPFIKTREPGGTRLGEMLRRVALFPDETYEIIKRRYGKTPGFALIKEKQLRTKEADILLFQAARAELVNYVIEPNLKSGVNVIADRFADSTRAYQGGGVFHSDPAAVNFINTVHNFIIRDNWPNLTFLIDISCEVAYQRLGRIDKGKDAFESRGISFFEYVRREYLALAKENPARVKVIDGNNEKQEVYKQILKYVKPLYGTVK